LGKGRIPARMFVEPSNGGKRVCVVVAGGGVFGRFLGPASCGRTVELHDPRKFKTRTKGEGGGSLKGKGAENDHTTRNVDLLKPLAKKKKRDTK